MADEDKINKMYKQGVVNATLILTDIKREYVNEAVSLLAELTESAPASYEALSSGDMKRAYEKLKIVGTDIMKLAELIPDNPHNLPTLGACMNIIILNRLTEVDMEKIEKEFVYGRDGIVGTYKNWILPKLKD